MLKINEKGKKYLMAIARTAQPIFAKNGWRYELPNKSPSVERIYHSLVDLVEGIDLENRPDEFVSMSGRFIAVASKGFDLGFVVSLEIFDLDDLKEKGEQ